MSNKIIDKIESLAKGRFFRLRYCTQVTLSANWRKAGYTMLKIVDTTARTGVSYKNINGVELKENYQPKENNWEWILKNKVKYNSNTCKYYFVVAPIEKGSNTETSYVLTKNDGTSKVIDKETAKTYTTKSYWNKSKTKIMNISLDNIISIR